MLSLQLATHLLYRQDGIILPLLPLSKNAYWLRVNHTSDLPGFKPQTRKECLLNQGKRKRRKGSKKREMWYVSRHDDLRTEVWRGCTPEVPKL
jgi:hypothetical protein